MKHKIVTVNDKKVAVPVVRGLARVQRRANLGAFRQHQQSQQTHEQRVARTGWRPEFKAQLAGIRGYYRLFES